MADIIGSFSKGFGLGNRVVDRYQQQQDRDRNLQEHDEDRARKKTLQDRQDIQWQQSQDDRSQGLKDAEEARKRNKVIQDRQDIQWQQSQKEYSYQNKQRQNAEDDKLMQTYYQTYLSTGDFAPMDDTTKSAFDRHPLVRESLFNSNSQDYQAGMQATFNVMSRLRNDDLPSEDDPDLLSAANFLMQSEMQGIDLPPQVDGKQVSNREVIHVLPTEHGGYAITQRITFDDGTTKDAPLTLNRSSDPNDQVAIITPQALMRRFQSAAQAQQNRSPEDLQKSADFYQLHWGGLYGKKGNGGTRASGGSRSTGSGGGNGSKYTKEYMADIADIEKQTAERITQIQNDPTIEGEAKQKAIAQAQAEGDERAKEKAIAWSTFTTVNDPYEKDREKTRAIHKFVNDIVSRYNEYDFDEDSKAVLRKSISNGMTPKEVEEILNQQIASGEIKKKQDRDLASKASSIFDGWRESQSQQGEPTQQQPAADNSDQQPQSLDELVLNPDVDIKEKLAAIKNSGLPEDEQSRLRERASYAGVYRAGNAIADAYSKPSPLRNFKHQGFQYGNENFGLSNKG